MGDELLKNLSVKKSNELISSKFNASLLEQQVMTIALSRIEQTNDVDDPFVAKLYPGELKRLISDEAHIYRDLKKLSKKITGHTMFVEDGKGNFEAFSLVPSASYIDGVFTISFNKALKQHVFNLEKNFSSLMLSIMTQFKKSASFRLYEILYKDAYKIKYSKVGYIQVEYNVSELKFMIGIANADSPVIKKEMAENSVIDWDELYNKLPKEDKKYENWTDFQRYVLNVAKDELQEKSNIRFEYEGIRLGRKVKRILFTIYENEPQNYNTINERARMVDRLKLENRQMEIPVDIYPDIYNDFVGHNNLSIEDITLLLKKSGFNEEKVRRAIKLADEQDYINNYMGWLVKCIENDYNETNVLKGSEKRAQEINKIKESYEDKKQDTGMRVWNKAKNNKDFVNYLEETGLNIEYLEEAFDVEKRIDYYLSWKINKG